MVQGIEAWAQMQHGFTQWLRQTFEAGGGVTQHTRSTSSMTLLPGLTSSPLEGHHPVGASVTSRGDFQELHTYERHIQRLPNSRLRRSRSSSPRAVSAWGDPLPRGFSKKIFLLGSSVNRGNPNSCGCGRVSKRK